MDRCVVVDVGSTTTKAVLLRHREGRWEMVRREAPTTVEAPAADVGVGLRAALHELMQATGAHLIEGERPTLPLFATSSAGGGLAMIVTGLVKRVSSRSGELAALGAGAVLLDTIALDDGRVPWRKVEALRRLRPDLLLFAGGFDGGAISGPVLLAELVREAALTPKLDPGARLPVLYAGNQAARRYVEEALGERSLFLSIENLRPENDRENLEPARQAILEIFHEHVMSHAPGYSGLVEVAEKPVLPTPTAVGALLSLVSREIEGRMLVIDLGGATTDVFTAENGQVFRTVSANLGMSYSALHVLATQEAGLRELLGEMDFGRAGDLIAEKHVHPTRLPRTVEELRVERALAAAAVRGAVREHLAILGNQAFSRSEEQLSLRSIGRKDRGPRTAEGPFALSGYDLVVGSGGALSHPPRSTVATLLIDALRPTGVVRLGVDRAFVFPHLGVLASTRPELALELWKDVGFVSLGTLVAPSGRSRRGRLTVLGHGEDGSEVKYVVERGEVVVHPLPADRTIPLALKVRGLKLAAREATVAGGEVGLLLDARGRPPEPETAVFFAEDTTLPPRREEAAREPQIEEGTILVRRELAVPGELFVSAGDEVSPETLLCRSVRTFPRPFFVDVAGRLAVPPEKLRDHLEKREGDPVEAREQIAHVSSGLRGQRTVLAPVTGRLERILPDGRVVIRETSAPAHDTVAVEAAKELSLRPKQLAPYLLVAEGDEVDQGQALVRVMDGVNLRSARSPVRGRVTRIDLQFGILLVAPLVAALEIRAALPGEVVETNHRGAVLSGSGLRISGLFGVGGEACGELRTSPARGAILAAETPPVDLDALAEAGVVGLLTGGIPYAALTSATLPFPIVLVAGFGRRSLPREMVDLLRSRERRPALLDATTEMRAGVKRPFLVVR